MGWFKKVLAFFERFFTNTTWEQKVSAGIGVVAPSLETIVALTASEADSAEIQKVVSEVQTDLATVSGLIGQAQGGVNVETTIVKVLDSVKANLAALLSAGHIKDQATVTKVTAITTGVINEIEAILPLIPLK